LKRHTGSLAYLDALAADGAMRFGLDGQPMGPVSAEHRVGAIEAMTKNACNQRSTAREA
jgi:sRNA-binding protein